MAVKTKQHAAAQPRWKPNLYELAAAIVPAPRAQWSPQQRVQMLQTSPAQVLANAASIGLPTVTTKSLSRNLSFVKR